MLVTTLGRHLLIALSFLTIQAILRTHCFLSLTLSPSSPSPLATLILPIKNPTIDLSTLLLRFEVSEISQVDKNAKKKDAPTTETEKHCRDPQENLGHFKTYQIQQENHRERWDRIYRKFIARSIEPILRQPDIYSFIPKKYASDVFICHTRLKYHNRFSNPKPQQTIKASGTGGMLQLRRRSI